MASRVAKEMRSAAPLVKDTVKDQSESDPKRTVLAERLVRELESKADLNPGKATGKFPNAQHFEFHRGKKSPDGGSFSNGMTPSMKDLDDDDCLGNLKGWFRATKRGEVLFFLCLRSDQQTKIEAGHYVKMSGSLTPVRA